MNKVRMMLMLAIIVMAGCSDEQEEEAMTAKKRGRFTFRGVTFEADYMSGCYTSSENLSISWSGIFYTTTESCLPGCEFCKITGNITIGMVTDTEEGNTGLNISGTIRPDVLNGAVGHTGSGDALFFAADRRKMHKNFAGMLDGDELVISTDFLIDAGLAHGLGLSPSQQIVPSGTYALFEDGNIVWWEVPLDMLRQP